MASGADDLSHGSRRVATISNMGLLGALPDMSKLFSFPIGYTSDGELILKFFYPHLGKIVFFSRVIINSVHGSKYCVD